ncbi:MAG: AzlD domain-containing protein [Actinomycetes bacterium]|jgi:branched-subunit amino acid transport protein|nr:AzlD domain-containing protein [Actinomycetes bacterium]
MTVLSRGLITGLIIGMCLVNYGLRIVPLSVLSRVQLPQAVMRWLDYIPVAVMGALFATEVAIPALQAAATPAGASGHIALWLNPGIYGALAAMLAFRLSRSFIGSTLAGVAVFALLQWLLAI